ncbi:hypothetical protein [Edaphocola flava]|uniref:hypothetical protein n=1 Tax=Edaphocola flava TaxID=2499629 RepID=UPI0013867E44|nr:hypothetical protein [Edaphocola flava]
MSRNLLNASIKGDVSTPVDMTMPQKEEMSPFRFASINMTSTLTCIEAWKNYFH